MKIYQLGPDVPYELKYESYGLTEGNDCYVWLVHDYRNDGYEGYGSAVALSKGDGLLYFKNLDHCSCYGPMDGGMESSQKITVEEFLRVKDDVLDFDAPQVLKTKVAELLER